MLKIKRIRRVEYHSPNSIQPIPSVLGKRKAGDLCVGYVNHFYYRLHAQHTNGIRHLDLDWKSKLLSSFLQHSKSRLLKTKKLLNQPHMSPSSFVIDLLVSLQSPTVSSLSYLQYGCHRILGSAGNSHRRRNYTPTCRWKEKEGRVVVASSVKSSTSPSFWS